MAEMRALIVLASVVAAGCFVEATSGVYVARDDHGTRPAYGLGLAVGIYLDPGPFRLSGGGGADFVHRKANGLESWNAGGSTYGRLDVNTGRRLSRWWPLRGTVAVAAGQGGVGVRMPGGSYEDDSGKGWSAFLGATTGIQAQSLGIALSLGPNVVVTEGALAGHMIAAGPQLRLRLSGIPGGLGTLWAHSNYRPSTASQPSGSGGGSCTPHTVTECRQTFFGRQCLSRNMPC